MNFFLRMRSFSLLLLLVCCLQLSLPIAATLQPRNESVPVVRVGWYPQQYIQQQGSDGLRSGMGYEYLMEMAKHGGWTYEYVQGSFADCLQMLEEGEIDLLSGVFYNAQTANRFDFASRPIGDSYMVLAVQADDMRYSYEAFDQFEGMQIGVVAGGASNAWLASYALENRFAYTEQRYENTQEMIQALHNKQVDAILINEFRLAEGQGKSIAKFAPSESYFAVRKGNAQMLTAINDTMQSVDEELPLFQLELEKKYMYNRGRYRTALTKEEQRCLQSYPTIRVTISSLRKPMMYKDHGQYRGIAMDIFKQLEQNLGVTFIFVEAVDQIEARALVQAGKADLMSNVYNDWGWAEANGLLLSQPYLELDYSSITRIGEGTDDAGTRVAAVKGYLFSENYILSHYPKEQIRWYSSEEDCVGAVATGKQDICFTNTYVATTYTQDYRYRGLYASPINFSHGLSLGIPVGAERALLLRAIDKSISAIRMETTYSIIAENTMHDKGAMSFQEMMLRYPLTFLLLFGIMMVLVFALIAVSLIVQNNRKKNIEISRARLEAQKDSITNLHNRLSYEVMTTQKIEQMRPGKLCAFVMLDIDHFKQVNDTYGHGHGDQMLIALANTMRQTLGEGSLLCRMGGDEFSAFFPQVSSKKWLQELIERFQQTLSGGVGPEGIPISCSIGVAITAEAGIGFDGLYNAADQALYQVKKSGRGSFCIYEQAEIRAAIAAPHRTEIEDARQSSDHSSASRIR